MDCRTGEIFDARNEALLGAMKAKGFIKEIPSDFLPERAREELARTGQTRIGRNTPCPCGSGRKFKRCCQIEPAANTSEQRGDVFVEVGTGE